MHRGLGCCVWSAAACGCGACPEPGQAACTSWQPASGRPSPAQQRPPCRLAGDECRVEVKRYEQQASSDYRLNYRLHTSCTDDVRELCHDIRDSCDVADNGGGGRAGLASTASLSPLPGRAGRSWPGALLVRC
jgi:hypothetical protein